MPPLNSVMSLLTKTAVLRLLQRTIAFWLIIILLDSGGTKDVYNVSRVNVGSQTCLLNVSV